MASEGLSDNRRRQLELAALVPDDFVEQHYSRIFRAALVLCGNAAVAEDLTQETFLQALRGRTRFSGRSRVETWLHAILFNVHRKRLRTRRRRWLRHLNWFARQRPADAPSTEARLIEDEWKATIWHRVAELPEPQKQVVLLRYAEEFSYEEISEIVQCPLGTVKSRLHHAIVALRRRLEAEEAWSDPQLTETAGLHRAVNETSILGSSNTWDP